MHTVHSPPYRVVTTHLSRLAEGPVWDAERQSVCYVDISGGHVHQYYTETDELRTLDMGEEVGAVTLCYDGNLLAALRSGLYFVDWETGERRLIDNPEPHLPENRPNDGKCDPAGRFWIGTTELEHAAEAGTLYLLRKDLNCTAKLDRLTISNGMAWSGDCRTYYFIDTPTNKVFAFDFDVGKAAISNRRVAVTIPEDEGHPDGMTIDADDKLWVAHYGGWRVARYDPTTGEKLTEYRLPAARVTSCTFGGPKLSDLYVTTARDGLSETELRAQPHAGALFVIPDCGYRGRPAAPFDCRQAKAAW